MRERVYGSGKKLIITWFFFILALGILALFITLIPYMRQGYQADLAKVGSTTFNVVYYAIVYFLVAFAFLIGFLALFYAFLYPFSRKIILTEKTLIFKEVFHRTEIKLKEITHFAIGKVDIPIVYSTGYGPMGSISTWDYPSIYYKKDGKTARLVLPWFELDEFIKEIKEKAPWIKIKIPKRYLR